MGSWHYPSSLANIIEAWKIIKQSTFTAFIDFSKAFDRINMDFLWLKLEHLGLPSKMLNAIKTIYNYVSCCGIINSVKTDFQGCLFTSLLFNLFLNDLSQEIKNCARGVNIEHEKVSQCKNKLLYADDFVLNVTVKASRRCLMFFTHGVSSGQWW